MAKRWRLPALLALVLLLAGCGAGEEAAAEQSAEAVVQAMLDAAEEGEEADALVWYRTAEEAGDYLSGFYRLEEVDWLDAAVVRMEGARAFELAVLKADRDEIDTIAAALQEYRLDRQGAFTGYFPAQADLADRGLVLTRGQYAALVVCQDPERVKNAFERCLEQGGSDGKTLEAPPPEADASAPAPEPQPDDETPAAPEGRVPFAAPGKDDMSLYDASPILSAWESGDGSALSQTEQQVLDAAGAVLEECLTSDMTDYEKELALYTWLTGHVEYDHSHYSPKGAPRTSYEPYGPLINGKGVCLGYATAFQLLMDMAGVECITVVGAAFDSREDHAWNMVRLSGEWYCVDATWDQGRTGRFRFFNVTSGFMAWTDHQWDYSAVPEAAARDRGQA